MSKGPDLTQLDPEEIDVLRGAFRRTLDKKRSADPAGHFPWHRLQDWVFGAPNLFINPVRIILGVGGNRSGKSKLAMGILSQLLRRTSPLNKQLLTTDPITGDIRVKQPSDPLRIWIVPPTGEKYREDWVHPADGMGIRYWMGDRFLKHRQSPDNVFLGAPPGVDPFLADGTIDEDKCDRILGKSQDQDLLTFESSEVDVAFFDEEPSDPDIVTSTMMRIATTNGVVVFAYTPLMGLSWSYDLWWKPLIKQRRAVKVADRCWIDVPKDPEMGAIICVQMGMADNPRARVYAKEVMLDPHRSEAEKMARVYGEYGFVAGALISALAGIDVEHPNVDHEVYVVDELPEAFHINRWILVADPNKSYGAVLACVDDDGNVFLVAEHLEESWPNRMHSAAFKVMCKKYASGPVEEYADPGSAGGQSIIDLNDFGHDFSPVVKGPGSVSRTIKRVRGLAWVDPVHTHPITRKTGSPRLFFYRPGLVQPRMDRGILIYNPRVAEQLSQARQKEKSAPDTPDKDSVEKLDLFDCVRYIADLAQSFGPASDDKDPILHDPDRMKPEETLLESSRKRNMPGQEIWAPTYDFE